MLINKQINEDTLRLILMAETCLSIQKFFIIYKYKRF